MSARIDPSARTQPAPPTPADLLAALRSDDAPTRDAAYRSLAYTADPATDAPHAHLRATLTRPLAAALLPADHDLVRWLLEQEIAAHEAAATGASETLYILIAALARTADPADALTIWRARNATPETRTGVDVEQLLRAGVDPVRRTLTRLIRDAGPDATSAAQALAWLESGLATGAADDLPAYFAWSDERFGIQIDCPTCRFAAPVNGLPAE